MKQTQTDIDLDDWATVDTERPGPVASSSIVKRPATFVAPRPQFPTLPTASGEAAALEIAAAEALKVGAGGLFENTSAVDRAVAKGLTLAYYVIVLIVLVTGATLWLWLGWERTGAAITALAVLSFGVVLWRDLADMKHSKGGIELEKLATLRQMHSTELTERRLREREARRDVLTAYMEMYKERGE